MLILLLGLGCRDPQLAPFKDALSAYDAGKSALAAGDAPGAVAHFADAAKADPESPSLPAWEAWAQDKAGDTAGARATLEAALAHFPDDVTLRYNHAALLARTGEVEAAADDLKLLYAAGTVDPVDVGQDPDFAALARDPALASLAPPPAVAVTAQGEAGAILLGEIYTLNLTLRSQIDTPISFSDMGEPTGLLRHVRTVEDVDPPDGHRVGRTLSVSWRAIGAGTASMGPWLVVAGPTSVVSDKVPVQVVAVPNRGGGAPDEAGTVYAVSALFAGRAAPWAGRAHGGVLVLSPPGAQTEVTGGTDPEPVQLELRANGQTQATGLLYRIPGAVHVRISSGGTTLLDQDVPANP